MRKLTLAVGVAMLSTIGLFATSHAGDTSATMEKMKENKGDRRRGKGPDKRCGRGCQRQQDECGCGTGKRQGEGKTRNAPRKSK